MAFDWRREIADRLASLRLRPEREAEIVEELGQHLAEHVEHLVAAGADPDAARTEALADLDRPGELARRLAEIETRPPLALPPPGAPARARWLHARVQDVRHSLRALRRTPGFTLTVIATLALTIGPTTAILSIGNWLLWRPMPGVTDADRLAVVWFGEWRDTGGVSPSGLSYLNLEDLQGASRTLAGIAGLQEGSVSLAAGSLPPFVAGAGWVTANALDVLGVRLTAGRMFTADDDRLPHGAQVAIVSEGLARRAFGGADRAIGQRVTLNGRPLSIVGVVAAPFAGTEPFSRTDVWYPGATYGYVNHFTRSEPVTREDSIFYSFVVRLAPGATFEAAQAELDVLVAALADRYPEANSKFKTVRARIFPGLGPMVLQRAGFGRNVRDLLIVGGVLLLLGCANVANLLMMRGVRTRRERAIRLALGASRARLVQLQLTESAIVAVAGGAVGLTLALWLKQFIVTLILPELDPGTLPGVPLDARVLTMTLGVAVTCGIAAGLIPALSGAKMSASPSMTEAGSRSVTGSRRLRTGLAVVQLSLSLSLVVVGALLLVTSLRQLYSVDLGFDPSGVSVHGLDPSGHGYTPDRFAGYYDGVLDRLRDAPGLQAVALAYRAPFGSGRIMRLQDPAGGEQDRIQTYANAVSPSYFDTLGIPVLRGRTFLAHELAPRSDVAVIGASLARRLFGEQEAIGRPVVLAERPVRELRVVGVAGDTHWRNVTGEPDLLLYLPWGDDAIGTYEASLIVKSATPPRDVEARVAAAAAEVDPTLPVNWSVAMSSRIDEELADQRVFAWMLSLLGWLGFTLAAVGLYGLLAQSVSERTREFWIRIALGSDRRGIFGLVLRQAAWLGALGTAAGLLLAFFGSGLIESQLYGVTRLDPVVYAGAAALLAAVALVAGLWPARTATRIQPVEALRE